MSDSEIISELCRRIKETRMQLGLSQIELAERAQVGAATIKRVELGESVTLSTLIGILRGLDRLHQLESVLFDSHIRTFNAQINAATPSRIRIRKKRTSQKKNSPPQRRPATLTPPSTNGIPHRLLTVWSGLSCRLTQRKKGNSRCPGKFAPVKKPPASTAVF
jgi:transcriptional regulator with XRE-family HTH domain